MSRRTPPPRPLRRSAVPPRVAAATSRRAPAAPRQGARRHGSTQSTPARRGRTATTSSRPRDTPRARPAAPRRKVAAPQRSRTTTHRFAAGQPRRRLIAMLTALVLIFMAVLTRVWTLQTTHADSLRIAGAQQWTRSTTLDAERGTIFDRNGEELAMSVPASTISINPKLIQDPAGTAAMLTSVLGLTPERHAELLEEMVARDRGFVYVARQVDDALGEQIDALDIAGVDVVREDRRVLPGGDTALSVIGLTDIDGIGIAGLEEQYDDVLTGTGGEMTREVSESGRSIAGTETVSVAPIPGDDLVLTLDRSIQFATERALLEQVAAIQAKGATAIVMDSDTGEIYAMASVHVDGETGAVEVTSGNFAVVSAYEPGSVAKVITMAAALNEGAVEPTTSFLVPWRKQWYDDLLKDSHQHPDEMMDVTRILVESSNIGTIEVQQTIGRERHWEYMRAFGLGETTALGFPDESPGILKPPDELWGSERVTVSYGQGVSSTSMQLAAAINVIANGGTYVAPKLVKATVGPDGTVSETAPSPTHEVVSAEVAAQVRDMMVQVVCSASGTASRARVDSFNVAGKTGTGLKAQEDGTYWRDGHRVYYSSFVGFFPAEDPQVTLLISVDEPKAGTENRFGGTAAAPVFAELAPTIVHELGIEPPTGVAACGDA